LQESEEIFDRLRSSYDSLPTDGDRAMFCDIACMLIGMEKEVALMIWKSCGRCSRADCCTSKVPTLVLRRLMDRSLVRVDDRGRLRMHDVLRDMGRDIVKRQARRSEKRTHLWDAATALKVLRLKKASVLRF
jgi:trans-2-enoyl-CoA reductase